jgi:hemolysin activation/secretion protein
VNLTRIQPLGGPWSLMASAMAQHTRDRLLSGELIGFGGTGIGRGYLSSSITGERGQGAIIELRVDTDMPLLGKVQFYVSADRASTRTAAHDPSGSAATHQRLASHAFGSRVALGAQGSLDLQVANPNWAVSDDGKGEGPRYLFSGMFRF